MSPEERDLWARHLDLKRAINGAYFRQRIKEAQKLEVELRALEDRIFARWRKPRHPASPPERFSYNIPVVDGETGQVLRHLVADQGGVHDPSRAHRDLPQNTRHREWLKAIDDSTYARDKAARTWQWLGHQGRPCCPGCRARAELVFLEFRNWDDDARFKIPNVIAVCDRAASQLLRRSRREFFGVTALGTKVPLRCSTAVEEAVPTSAPLFEHRPVRRHPDGNADALVKARAALAEKRAKRAV